jgi:hypothetical protein
MLKRQVFTALSIIVNFLRVLNNKVVSMSHSRQSANFSGQSDDVVELILMGEDSDYVESGE